MGSGRCLWTGGRGAEARGGADGEAGGNTLTFGRVFVLFARFVGLLEAAVARETAETRKHDLDFQTVKVCVCVCVCVAVLHRVFWLSP